MFFSEKWDCMQEKNRVASIKVDVTRLPQKKKIVHLIAYAIDLMYRFLKQPSAACIAIILMLHQENIHISIKLMLLI